MQLGAPDRTSPLRRRLGAAACMLLASGTPVIAGAESAASTQFDASALLYGEASRANVVEPTARITRVFASGQSLSAQLGVDVISGASPSGALPSGAAPTGQVQTVTTPSGNVKTIRPPDPNQIPTTPFKDNRGVFDAEWQAPFAEWLRTALGGHFSREKDYQSLGATAKLSVDLMHRLATVTAGAGYNRDGVFPVGGSTAGLSDTSLAVRTAPNPKRVTSGMVGVSRVITRCWLMSVNASRTVETGYLTEPYKVVSLLDGATGMTTGQLTEKRPSTRQRADLLATSVYRVGEDVLHLSYRYYWDDWRVRSSAVDLKYRRDLSDHDYLQPHVRYYTQTPARFFTFGLIQGARLPEFATSDERLGPLHTMTLGTTYGFHIPDYPGEWSVRAEYIRQSGDGHPRNVPGIQRKFDLFPAVNIGTLVVGYSISF